MKQPKILFLDIETNGINGFKADLAYVLCAGYSWMDEDEVKIMSIDDYPNWKDKTYDDSRLLKDVHKLLQEADIIAGHYLKFFDLKFLKGRFAIHGLPPITHLKVLDTTTIARNHFKFSSNRLKNLAKVLPLKEQKQEKGDGWPMWWFKCAMGDEKAMADMKAYCIQDVLSNKNMFIHLRPYWPKSIVGESLRKVNTLVPKFLKVLPDSVLSTKYHESFLSKIDFSQRTYCWNWKSHIMKSGHGRFHYAKKSYILAHRAVYSMFKGNLKDGSTIKHLCYNPLCCNPEHLEQID